MTASPHGALRTAYLVAFALGLSACANGGSSSGGSYGTGDPTLTAPNPGSNTLSPFITDGKAVLRALDAIAARSGKPLRVKSLDSDEQNGLMVEVQEPANHINIDQYTVAPDGTLTGPTPVQLVPLNGGKITVAEVNSEVFDPKALGFARLTQTAREAIAKSGFSDARVLEWEFDGLGPDDKRDIYLVAARGRPVAIVRKDLSIQEMRF